MSKSRKHHYVTQSLLRAFGVKGKSNQIFVFDKSSSRSFLSSIRDAGCENHFNSLMVGDRLIPFEDVFQEVDNSAANILNKIRRQRSVSELSRREREGLSLIAAIQLVRTKLARTTLVSIAEQLNEISSSEFEFTDEDAKRAALRTYLDPHSIIQAFQNKDLILIKSPQPNAFIVSDNPLVRFNQFPYGELGISSPGIKIYFPISPDLVIGFYCKSVARHFNLLMEEESNLKNVNRYVRICAAFKDGAPVSLGPMSHEFFNELQIHNSSRFLYSSENDFAFARGLLDAHENLREVKSTLSVGEPGKILRNSRMPDGIWIVFYGSEEHGMIHASHLQNDSWAIEFETLENLDLEKLKAISMIQVSVFENGFEISRMREVKIEIVKAESPFRIRIKHRNESLNDILKSRFNNC